LRGALFGSIKEGVEPGTEQVKRAGELRVTMADFEKAFAAVKPSVTKKQAGKYKVLASRFGSGELT